MGQGKGQVEKLQSSPLFLNWNLFKTKQMFAHAFPLLCPALHVEAKKEETGWEQLFTSQFDRELESFREFQVTVQEAFSKNVEFC